MRYNYLVECGASVCLGLGDCGNDGVHVAVLAESAYRRDMKEFPSVHHPQQRFQCPKPQIF
jgi:hypothetical protein